MSDVEEDNAGDKQQETIVLDGDGRVTAMTQYDQYVNKGHHLRSFSLYDYVACIKMKRIPR